MRLLYRAKIRLLSLLSVSLMLILLEQSSVVRVGAHSGDLLLVRSTPTINAVLSQPPEVIQLWFEDPLIAEFSSFQLRDINTRLIDTAPSQINGDDLRELFMPLEADIPDGIYTVTYQVISAVDGHEGVGSFAFIVGEVSDTEGNVLTYNETVAGVHAGVRGLHTLALTIILGGCVYIGLNAEANRFANRMGVVGWILFGLSQLFLLSLQATTMVIPDSGNFSDLLLRYLTSTRFGIIWCLIMMVWLLMGFFVVRQPRAWMGFSFGAILVALLSISGRVTASPDVYAAVAVYWLHTLCSGLWLGGLLFIAFRQMTVHCTNAEIWQKFRRFSVIALPLIALTGLYNSWLRAGTLEGLTSTAHGQTLIVKVLLVVGLIATFVYFGWKLRQKRIVGPIQIFSGLAVLAFTGVLVTLTPGREITALRHAIPPVLESETTIQELFTADGLHLQLYVTPGIAGANRLDALIFESTTGVRLNNISCLMFDLVSPEGEPYQLQASFQGDGLYTAEDVEMSISGLWEISLIVTRPSEPDVIMPLAVNLAAPVSNEAPVLDIIPPSMERLIMGAVTGVLLVTIGSAVLFLSAIIQRSRTQRVSYFFVGLSIVLVVGLVIHSVIYIISGVLLIAWMGVLAGSAGRKAYKAGNWDIMLAMVSVLVGAILLISSGFIPFTVP